MRRALIVGINRYERLPGLDGCVDDALAVSEVLERHANGDDNFQTPHVLTADRPSEAVTKAELRRAVRHLFAGQSEIALLYFAGHGHVADPGGVLCASDSQADDDGLAVNELMTIVHGSNARNKIVVLDCCDGRASERATETRAAAISAGVTILTASSERRQGPDPSVGDGGIFTMLFVDALQGSAGNLVGAITVGSIYAHIDQSLGPWAQRPVFKTNVEAFVPLRKVEPPIPRAELRALTTHFPHRDHDFRLDPSYEPERCDEQRDDATIPPPDPAHTAVFKTLQNYVRVNLVRPVGAPHMWHAAMQYESCQLTVLGQHYWRLVHQRLI
jgi:hypothetical protein